MSQTNLESSRTELSSLLKGLRPLYPQDTSWSENILKDDPSKDDFKAALEKIELALESDSKNPELKLWWIRCQLEVGTLPLAALAAPLNEIAPEVQERQDLQALGCSTFVKAAISFFFREQLRLGVHMLRQANEFVDSLDSSQANLLLTQSRIVVTDEVENAPLRREEKSYLSELGDFASFLDQKLTSISKHSNGAADRPEQTTSTRSAILNSKSILDEAKNNDNVSDLPDSNLKPVSPGNRKIVQGDTGTGLRLFGILFLLGLLGVFLFAWKYVFHDPAQGTVVERLAAVTLDLETPQLITPSPESFSGAGGDAESIILDSVSSRLENLSRDPKGNNKQDPAKNEVDQEALKPENGNTLPNSDDELVSMTNLPPARNAITDNNIPEITPDRFANTKVNDVGTSGRKAHADSGGSNKSNNASQPSQPKNQTFNPPKLYRTITPTEVLSAPSLLAKSLARLEINTPVHVTKKMGHWLELRSTGGRTGFIYAQDASPAMK